MRIFKIVVALLLIYWGYIWYQGASFLFEHNLFFEGGVMLKTIDQIIIAAMVLSGIVAVIVGILFVNQVHRMKAQVNEYEYILADTWAEKEDCIKQMGVFYAPRDRKGG